MWTDPLHDNDFIESLITSIKSNKDNYSTSERMIGLLTMMSEVSQNTILYTYKELVGIT